MNGSKVELVLLPLQQNGQSEQKKIRTSFASIAGCHTQETGN